MRNLPNIEPSGFRRGAYVGYGGGAVWTIKRSSSSLGSWCATPQKWVEGLPSALYSFTLPGMSAKLQDEDGEALRRRLPTAQTATQS